MLEGAAWDQVCRWEGVPEDCRWYRLEQPVVVASDPLAGPKGWSNIHGGPRNWKMIMMPPASAFARLLRAFGVDPDCACCNMGGSCNGSFDSHTAGAAHYQTIYKIVEERLAPREALWQVVNVVGGQVCFNHLDGEIQAMREPMEPEVLAMLPEHLPNGCFDWALVGAPACVPMRYPGEKDRWPNMWSARHWKEKMERPARRITQILEASGGLYTSTCTFCPDHCICVEHLLGPKHYTEVVVHCVHERGGTVCPDDYWQTWTCVSGAVAYNHVDGTIRMVRKPLALEDAGEVPPPPDIEGLMVPGEGNDVAGLPLCRPYDPPARVQPVEPAARGDTMTVAAMPPLLPSPVAGSLPAFLWERHALSAALQLDALLREVQAPRCTLCARAMHEGVAAHISRSAEHLMAVQMLFSEGGAEAPGWLQTWPGIVEVHHLTMQLSTSHISSGEVEPAPPPLPPLDPAGRSEGAGKQKDQAATVHMTSTTTGQATVVADPWASAEADGLVKGSMTVHPVAQPCLATQDPGSWSTTPTPSRAAATSRQAEPVALVPSDTTNEILDDSDSLDEWEAFQDPNSGRVWYHNSGTGESRWTLPLLHGVARASPLVGGGSNEDAPPLGPGSGGNAGGSSAASLWV